MNTLPLVGLSSKPISCKRVVFPEPEGPTSAVNSPFWMERSTPRRALVSTSPILKTRVALITFVTSILDSCSMQCFDGFHAGSQPGRIELSNECDNIGKDYQVDGNSHGQISINTLFHEHTADNVINDINAVDRKVG